MCLRILIVEDEPLIALHLEAIFEDAGHHVVGTASSLKHALNLTSTNLPLDLAIMDIDLADGSDGIETARQLREDYGIGSLFVSARLDEPTQARALECEPVGFLVKPFAEFELFAALEPLCREHSPR